MTVLETHFHDAINDKIRFGYPSNSIDLSNAYSALQAGRYLQSNSELERTRLEFVASVNNLSQACDYIRKLSTSVSDDALKSGVLHSNQYELFDSCLSDFNALVSKFNQLARLGVQQIYVATFKAIIKSMVDAFASSNHVLGEEDIFQYEATDGLRPFVQTFLVQLNTIGAPFKKQLTEENFDLLVELIGGEYSTRLYKSLFKCSFNKVSHDEFLVMVSGG